MYFSTISATKHLTSIGCLHKVAQNSFHWSSGKIEERKRTFFHIFTHKIFVLHIMYMSEKK